MTDQSGRLSTNGKPVVLFGCKSDPDTKLVVDPSEADSFGQPFNVGLIEVTHATSDGKSKMRNGLRWLLYKLEQRQRKSPTQAYMVFADAVQAGNNVAYSHSISRRNNNDTHRLALMKSCRQIPTLPQVATD